MKMIEKADGSKAIVMNDDKPRRKMPGEKRIITTRNIEKIKAENASIAAEQADEWWRKPGDKIEKE